MSEAATELGARRARGLPRRLAAAGATRQRQRALAIGRLLGLGGASGLLVGACFLVPVLAPAVFVALVPLLAASGGGVPGAMVAGAMTGAAAYALGLGWLPATLTRFHPMPPLAAWLLFVGVVLYHALQFAAFGAGAALVTRPTQRKTTVDQRPAAVLIAGWGAVWVLVEWSFPMVLPWSLGDALAPDRLLRQAADLGGVHGLAFLIVVVNGAVVLGLDRRQPAPLRRRGFAVALGVVGLILLYGAVQIAREMPNANSPEDSIGVGIIQGAIPAEESHGGDAVLHAWDTYAQMTNRLLAQPAAAPLDVVIWPETTLGTYLRTDDWYRERLERLATQSGRTLIVGALDHSDEPAAVFNSAFAFAPGDRHDSGAMSRLQIYHKMLLLPWGEYLPGGRWSSMLRRWRTTGEFSAGAERSTFALGRLAAGEMPPVLAAPSICAEVLQAGWFNPLVQAGAAVLINLTDDGWFAGTAAPDLHFQLARIRAVETRRWLVRASNSGMSAVIDPTGEIMASVPVGRAGTIGYRVLPSDRITPYVRFGEWMVWISLAIVVLTALHSLAARSKPRRASRPTDAGCVLARLFFGVSAVILIALNPLRALAGTATHGGTSEQRVYAYVTIDAAALAVIDLNAGVRLADVTYDANVSASGLAVGPSGSRVYAATQLPGQVIAIDTSTNTVVMSVPVRVPAFDVAVTPDGTRLYATDGQSIARTIAVVDVGCGRQIGGINVGGPSRSIAVHPNGATAFAFVHGLTAIDIATGAVTPLASLDGIPSVADGFALTPDGAFVYVSEDLVDEVAIIDTTTGVVVERLPVASQPRGIAMAPDGQHAYVVTRGNSSVNVIDTVTRRPTDTIRIGACPGGCFFSGIAVSPDGGRLYVTDVESDTVTVLDTATRTAVDTIAVGPSPNQIVVVAIPDTPAPTPPCLPTATPTPLATPVPRFGDCNGNGVVTIDDLVVAVNVALGVDASCPAADLDGDGRITIAELIRVIANALEGG
jgi:apolipoprotein N-acyltransferase